MFRSFSFIVITGMLIIACRNATQPSQAAGRKNGFTPVLSTREDSLYHDVMQGHDIGMAKIGAVHKYIGQLQQALDSLHKLPSAKINIPYQGALTEVLKELNKANDDMNTWMDEFKADSAAGHAEWRIKYLEAEKQKVTKVKEQILNSLHRADSVLNKF